MRIEELLDKGLQVEVDTIRIYNRLGNTGAKERVVIASLRLVQEDRDQFNVQMPGYFEFSFDLSQKDIDKYQPGTRFNLAITPAK